MATASELARKRRRTANELTPFAPGVALHPIWQATLRGEDPEAMARAAQEQAEQTVARAAAAEEADLVLQRRRTVQTRHRGRSDLLGTSLLGLLGEPVNRYLKSLLGE